MTYFMLPRSHLFLYKNIQYQEAATATATAPITAPIAPILFSPSMSSYLYQIKEKITEKEKIWDVYKKYTNPYEYIHTTVPQKKKSVSKYKPISRSFFKMVEMVHTFRMYFRDTIHSFHLAEGPGGFIEAMVFLRNEPRDRYIGMTLQDSGRNDPNIPGWKKSEGFMKTHPNVSLENGADQTGNLLSVENFEYVVAEYGGQMEMVTADGGFDFSMDFNQQEQMIGKLLFAQMAFALCLNKYRGHFVLKIFDCFMPHTVDIIYILSSFYEKVFIIKPHTSRYANSERYIVCLGFLYDTSAGFYPFLLECFHKMMESDNESDNPFRFLNVDISQIFSKKIEEYSAIFGQKQIQNIMYTLSLIENKGKAEKIETLIQTNIQKSADWCNRFQVPFHSMISPSNLFLGGEL
jgi:23S rRNA U2552 (ribose-2'-O)-methylase RlmE/FtsJ